MPRPPRGVTPPAIAIVDSGIDASKTADFGNRVVASVNFSSTSPNATGDDEGHGTMVAGIAAGASSDYPGVAPTAPLVSVRTADANGMSYTSDVIAGIDWILQNKDTYNIRVANFSIAGGVASSFTVDPLDQAVEKLWFNGVVVVAAAGNHGTGNGAGADLRPRQRSVRDHGRRVRPERRLGHVERHGCSVVGVRHDG